MLLFLSHVITRIAPLESLTHLHPLCHYQISMPCHYQICTSSHYHICNSCRYQICTTCHYQICAPVSLPDLRPHVITTSVPPCHYQIYVLCQYQIYTLVITRSVSPDVITDRHPLRHLQGLFLYVFTRFYNSCVISTTVPPVVFPDLTPFCQSVSLRFVHCNKCDISTELKPHSSPSTVIVTSDDLRSSVLTV